jgi:hypothetical protein
MSNIVDSLTFKATTKASLNEKIDDNGLLTMDRSNRSQKIVEFRLQL